MSNTTGWSGAPAPGTRPNETGAKGFAARIAERESGESLLRFLSRLSAFGLAAGSDPLLKPVKPAG